MCNASGVTVSGYEWIQNTRCAAMLLAFKRIEAHYMLEDFSQ